MTKLSRLLMASTVLSGIAGIGAAHAANGVALPSLNASEMPANIILAQAPDPDPRNRAQQQRRDERQQQRQDNRPDNRQNNQQDNRQNRQTPPPAATRQTPPPAANREVPPPAPGRDRNQNPQGAQPRNVDRNPNVDNRNANPNTDNRTPAATTTQDRGNQNRDLNRNQNPNQTRDGNRNPNQTGDGNRNQNQRGDGNRDQIQTRDRQNPDNRDPSATPTQDRGNQNQNQNRDQIQTRDRQNIDTRDPSATTRQGDDPRRGGADDPRRGGANDRQAPVTRSGNPAPTADSARPIQSEGKGKGVSVRSSSGQDIRSVDQLRNERREVRDGNRTVIREPDRTIIREGNRTIIRHDETTRFRIGARDVRVERVGNDSRTVIFRPGGERVVTLVDRNGFLLRRSRILPNGREIIIINNRPRVGGFFVVLPPPRIRIPRDRYIVAYRDAPPALIYETLTAPPVDIIERPYTLDEVRYSPTVRDRMPRVDLNALNFEFGSWELAPDQVDKLGPIAEAMKRVIDQDPQAVFLIEGHTDAVGDDQDNLSLSDRRAESVAVALTEQFGVPAENLTTQGYGEQQLVEQTDGPSEANRRVTVRNIGPLLAGRGDPGGNRPQGEPIPQ